MNSKRPIVLHIITSLNDGGAEAILYNLIKTAKEFDHKVISLMGPGKYGPKIKADGFDVFYVDLKSIIPSPYKIIKLCSYIKRARPNVIQTWMYHADFLGGLASFIIGYRAIVWGLHHTNLDSHGTKWTTRQLIRFNTNISHWLPSYIISCSKNGSFVHSSIGYSKNKIITVCNGYNTSTFKPDKNLRNLFRSEFNIKDQQILVGCVARYNPQKDHKNLILAFAKSLNNNTNLHLILVGPGMTKSNVEITNLIKEKNINEYVTLAGSRSDIPSVMNGLDLHVLSSAFGEAFPNVLSEAMSCGTPCVATDVGDSINIIGNTGIVVPPRNPSLLSKAILDIIPIIRNPNTAKICRARIVNNFTLKRMAEGYVDTWQKSMNQTDALSK